MKINHNSYNSLVNIDKFCGITLFLNVSSPSGVYLKAVPHFPLRSLIQRYHIGTLNRKTSQGLRIESKGRDATVPNTLKTHRFMKFTVQNGTMFYICDYSVDDKIDSGFLEEYHPDVKEAVDDIFELCPACTTAVRLPTTCSVISPPWTTPPRLRRTTSRSGRGADRCLRSLH